MGMEIEAAADLADAAIVASAIDGQSGAPTQGEECANCHAVLTGPFCSQCGQKGHLHRSVWHLGEELAHGTMHFDTKAWRTLPMLVWRPGELTRRYIDGQRTRFVSPLALFLFMVFFMFFVFSLTMDGEKVFSTGTVAKERARSSIAKSIERKEREVAKLRAKLEKASAEDQAGQRAALNEEETALQAMRLSLKSSDTAVKDGAAGEADKNDKRLFKFDEASDGKDLAPWLNNAIKHVNDNPELALYKLKNAASKYAVLLVPISLPFVWLMFFWKRGVTMYDHAVFTLYSLAAMALLYSVVAALGYWGFGTTAALLGMFFPPLHMYRQLRAAYGLGRFGAWWRSSVMVIVAMLVLALYTAVVLGLVAV